MPTRRRIRAHPGQVLHEEFLVPMGLSQSALAKHIGIHRQHVNELVWGKRVMTARVAWLLAQAFGTTPEFWLHLQVACDLAAQRPVRRVQRLTRRRPGRGRRRRK